VRANYGTTATFRAQARYMLHCWNILAIEGRDSMELLESRICELLEVIIERQEYEIFGEIKKK